MCACGHLYLYIFIYIRANEALQSISSNDTLSTTRGCLAALVPVLMEEAFPSQMTLLLFADSSLLFSYATHSNFSGLAQS